MIRMLEGRLVEQYGTQCVIMCSGVGYGVYMTVDDLAMLEADDGLHRVFIYTHARETGWELYGFLSASHRELFERIIKVNGIGPKGALQVLSCYAPDVFISIVRGGDEKRLTKVPGVGGKTAARIILEMKDKVDDLGQSGSGGATTNNALDEVSQALLALGYKEKQIDKIAPLLEGEHQDGLSGAALIKSALKHLSGKPQVGGRHAG